ncbi:Uncharacterized protein APZ42_019250 [Daphnia magna]|uniref:Uncharacterized protein n=1 Tax=Daphnia magna TaxID=35525 RepID=A0A164YEM1_9CRUS|nr:Uncharacterized protein APZ42_019250 [Daphnia magna]
MRLKKTREKQRGKSESSDTFRSPAQKDVVATRVTAADVLTGCS